MPIWNSAFSQSPSGAKPLGIVDDEIRALKNAIETLMAREFQFDLADPDNQMRAKAGTARPFIQASAPTVRADGTAFTEEDEGRIWIKHQYDGSPSVAQPIGKYYLKWDSGTYSWLPDPSSEAIGEIAFIHGTFTNPSGAAPYTSGTKPGWVLADGSTVIAGLPNPAGWVTVPAYNQDYVKLGSTGGATGGRDNFALTTAELPPHTHEPGTLSGTITDPTVAVNSTTKKVNEGNNLIGSSQRYLLADNSAAEDATNGHLSLGGDVTDPSVGITGATADNDAGATFASNPVNLDPSYTEMVAIIRMY